MTAWTSPERTTRSTPLRIPVPATVARRSSITSSLMTAPVKIRSTWTRAASRRARRGDGVVVQLDEHLAVDDGRAVGRHGAHGRQRQRGAGAQVERAAVLGALDRAVL